MENSSVKVRLNIEQGKWRGNGLCIISKNMDGHTERISVNGAENITSLAKLH